jgi:hypothetical protein
MTMIAASVRGKCSRPQAEFVQRARWPPATSASGAPQAAQ